MDFNDKVVSKLYLDCSGWGSGRRQFAGLWDILLQAQTEEIARLFTFLAGLLQLSKPIIERALRHVMVSTIGGLR